MSKQCESKRKPTVPVKRPHHSIKDSIPSADSVATTTAVPDPPMSPPRNSKHSKRTRLNFDPMHRAPKSSYHDISGDDAPSTLSLSRSPISSRHTIHTKSNSPRRKDRDKPIDHRELLPSHSREPLNPGNGKLAITKALAAITNNAKISDFFTITNKKRPTVKSVSIAVEVEATKENSAPLYPEESLTSSIVQAKDSDRTKRSMPDSTNITSPDGYANELEILKRRYEELQRSCQDKDEQLKAVSNNRTILHTALQTALRQREQELETLQNSTEDKQAKYRDALEELVRADACQEARELREKLATDGARLGRIMAIPTPTTKGPSRMLLHHRATLESWEDGYATKELQHSIKELQSKKAILEERLKVALVTEETFYAGKGCSTRQDGDVKARHDEELSTSVENKASENFPLSILHVREAVESVRHHLRNIRQQERELASAEQTLNNQKGAHVRALKRVASEDASRFRSRPKLNDRYVLRSLLGKGGFSEVWLAFDLIELREVAVKIHQLDSRWPDAKKENYTKHVSREYEIHRSVRHPRIVSLYDVFEIDTNSFATVLEACEGTDLDTLLKNKRYLPEREARAILLQILSGMNYLSQPSEDGTRQGIIHYDLKPGNVLFDQYGDAKITDFGLSKIVDSHDPAESMELTSQGAGTYWYLPPECFILEDNVRISNKVDVWSIGVIFFQMLFGKRPFGDGQSQDRMLANGTMLNAHTLTFPGSPEISSSCRDFIEACLTYDQRFRPTMAQICEHPYVTSREFV
jgi:tousled-like kinase